MNRFLPFFFALACFFGALHASPAVAHPHVWITYQVKVVNDKDGIRQLQFTWVLDEMFTSMVKEDFNLKTITEKDSAFIRDHAFNNLKKYHYYMDIKLDDAPFVPSEVRDFTTRLKGKKLEYQFMIALPKAAKKIELSLSDQEFYVDLEPPLQEIQTDKPGKSLLAEAKMLPKDYVSTASLDNSPQAQCEGHDGAVRKSDQWGDFPSFIVSCQAR